MSRRFRLATSYSSFIRLVVSGRIFYLITAVSFLISIVWIQTVNKDDKVVQEAIDNISHDLRYVNVYRKHNKLSKYVKYILLWTPASYSPFYFFGTGQEAFIRNKCAVTNCYVTSDRDLLDGDVTRFDAIAFNGRNLKYMRYSQLPRQRSMRQKYIFFNLESSENYPVCSARYDGYFNWTATYKLNSDIPYPYIVIKDNKNETVGPKDNIDWIEDDTDVDEGLLTKLKGKSKAIAWFVSSCSVRSKRDDFVYLFTKALASYKLDIHIYGKCGTYKCPIEKREYCNKMLEKDYYFYLAMENSFAEDYITEKVLTALENNIVPILYGAANYSRFLPPGSYIDARSQNVEQLASTVARLISSPKLYSQFFRWKRHYSLYDATATDNVCAVCAALHNKSMMEKNKVYDNFREWWHPHYRKRCSWIVDDDE